MFFDCTLTPYALLPTARPGKDENTTGQRIFQSLILPTKQNNKRVMDQ